MTIRKMRPSGLLMNFDSPDLLKLPAKLFISYLLWKGGKRQEQRDIVYYEGKKYKENRPQVTGRKFQAPGSSISDRTSFLNHKGHDELHECHKERKVQVPPADCLLF